MVVFTSENGGGKGKNINKAFTDTRMNGLFTHVKISRDEKILSTRLTQSIFTFFASSYKHDSSIRTARNDTNISIKYLLAEMRPGIVNNLSLF